MGNEEETRFEDLCRRGDQLFFQTLFNQKKERCPLEDPTAPATVSGLDAEQPDAEEPPVAPGRDGANRAEHRMPGRVGGKNGPA